jgi:hypothetical protein
MLVVAAALGLLGDGISPAFPMFFAAVAQTGLQLK